MSGSFDFSERVEKLKGLLGHLHSLWTEPSLRPPMVRLLVARTLVYLLPAIALLVAGRGSVTGGILVVMLFVLVLGPVLIYDTFQRGRLAHLFAAYARGTPSDSAGAKQALEGKGGRLFLLAFLEWAERNLQSGDESDQGLIQGLIATLLGEVLDVAGAYLLAAVVVDDLQLRDSVEELADLKDHLPATLVASVGFDSVISLITSFFWTPVVVLVLGAVVAVLGDLLAVNPALTWLGGVAVLLALPLAGLQVIREAAKAVYFTALYMLVEHPGELATDRQKDLEGLVELTSEGEAPGTEPGTAPA